MSSQQILDKIEGKRLMLMPAGRNDAEVKKLLADIFEFLKKLDPDELKLSEDAATGYSDNIGRLRTEIQGVLADFKAGRIDIAYGRVMGLNTSIAMISSVEK